MSTAYHAIHESPFDDACPDCAGYPEDAYSEATRHASRDFLLLCLGVGVILGIGYVLGVGR